MKKTSISLNKHLQEFISSQVNAGNYASVDEVVHTRHYAC